MVSADLFWADESENILDEQINEHDEVKKES